MNRRRLLQLGLASAFVFAAAGTTTVLLRKRAEPGGALYEEEVEVLLAVARGVLDGALPATEPSRGQTLDAHMQRLAASISGLAASTRAELAQLLSLLAWAPGRIFLAGLASPWSEAATEEIQHALQSMRSSKLQLRLQAYHALRDLTYAAYFADSSTWSVIGYPGPRAL